MFTGVACPGGVFVGCLVTAYMVVRVLDMWAFMNRVGGRLVLSGLSWWVYDLWAYQLFPCWLLGNLGNID